MIENFQEDSMKMQTDFGFSNEATQYRAVPRSHNTRLLSHVVHQEMEENYSKQSLSYDQKLSDAIHSADYIFKQQKQCEGVSGRMCVKEKERERESRKKERERETGAPPP